MKKSEPRAAKHSAPSKNHKTSRSRGEAMIVPRQRLLALAAIAARAQKVGLRQARAPKAVTTAIRELNAIAFLAGSLLVKRRLAGNKKAEQQFEHALAQPVRGFLGPLYPSAVSLALSGRSPALDRAGGGAGGIPGGGLGGGPSGSEIGPQRPCGDLLLGAQDVLQTAFLLDVRDGGRQPVRTKQAATYLRTRMGLVAQFEAALWEVAGDRPRGVPAEDFGGFGDPTDPTGGFGGPSEPILPPDDGGSTPPDQPPSPDPPPDSGGPGGLGPGWCENLGDLCVTLYEEAVAGLLGDPYIDLIASVEPDCVCHDYDPNRIFIARPAQGSSLPVPLPAEVRLIFRGQDITANIVGVTPQELSFRIPPNSETGNLYLRGPFRGRGGAIGGGNLERLCGFDLPDFPESLNEDTPVLISIIHPPVIVSFTVDGDPGPVVVAEACQLLNLCWQVRLDDPPPHQPIPPCARIEVILRDGAGNLLKRAGPEACVAVTSAAEEIFSLEAHSFAANQECGHAGPTILTIQRIARIDLIRDVPAGEELIAGTDGRFFVDVSCPAPAGGIEVRLTSSQPAALQVSANVPIPAGQTRMPVDFTTADDGRGPVEVRAMASGHQEGRLEYELVQSPAEICQALEDVSESWERADQTWSNWGIVDSNDTFLGFLPAPKLYRPTTQYELASAIKQAEADGMVVRAFGSGWGFSETVMPQHTAIQGVAQTVAGPFRTLALGGALSEAQLHAFARNFSGNFGYAIDTTTLDRSLQPLLREVLADDQDPNGFFFVEAGMTIHFLNTLLDNQAPRRALRTMGGASGQTIAGAFSTGTHGGDFDRPPLADAVRAIYLVGAGGVHHWIEPANRITDPAKLRATFSCLAETIHYDDDMFRSVLVSMGAMGVIYAVILEVVPQYSLLQWNKWSTWEAFKAEASPNSFADLFNGVWTGMRDFLRADPNFGNPPNRFAQVVVNPIRNEDGTHNCYVSNRVELPVQGKRGVTPLASSTDVSPDEIKDAIMSAPEFGHSAALNFHFHGPSNEGSVFDNLVALLIFCKENNYPWAARAAIDRVMQLTFPEPGNDPTVDVGYNVMAPGSSSNRPYPTLGGAAVESAFSFFPSVPSLDQPGLQLRVPDAISFVDTVLAAFDQGVDSDDKIFPAGWMSLRVTGRTAAYLGMERFDPSGMIEVVLIGRPDGYGLVRLVEQITRNEGGALHWGQSNGMVQFIDLESTYGNSRIDKWKSAQRALGGDTFTNIFMRRCGLA